MGVLPDDWTLPQPSDLTRDWFTSASLAVQTCSSCGTHQHPPEEICHQCGSMSFTTTEMTPTGTVYSYTVAHYPVHKALADAVPYAVVLISLDDAPEIRVVGNMVGTDHDQVRIGMAVSAVWEERTVEDETIQLLFWTAI
jgi:uncharacterized protein